jgi:hypothetical protein
VFKEELVIREFAEKNQRLLDMGIDIEDIDYYL